MGDDGLLSNRIERVARAATSVLAVVLITVGCQAGTSPVMPASSPVERSGAPVATGEGPTSSARAQKSPAKPAGSSALGVAPVGATERARVVRVVDGDTIVIDRGNGNERLRYIGVDTPESVKPGSPVEAMAMEATAANERLVDGKEVLLETDITEYDRFDRLLRYVWVADPAQPDGWLLVNLALLEQGYAQVVTYPPDVRYVEAYLGAQEAAREQGLGLWAEVSPTPGVPQPVVGGAGRDGCDPSYPDVCIPPSPPDLDCRDVTDRRFREIPPDPHRFDLDFDGIGCEGG